MRVAYLISQYPALSHTFILREILEMQRLEWDVQIASVNNPDRPLSAMMAEERQHAAQTLFIKAQGISGVLKTGLSIFFQRPMGFLRALACAFTMGQGEPRATLFQLFYFAEALILADWMLRQQLGHVHVHFANMAAAVALLCKKLIACKMSITVHGPDELMNHRAFRLSEKFQAADSLLCITDYARSQVCLHLPPEQWSKTHVVRVGLYPEEFLNLADTRTPDKSEPHIVSIGRLSPAKGHHILIEAMSLLRHQLPNARLTLIGTGPLEASLRQQIQALNLKHSVTLAGGLNQDAVRKILATADIFALSSFAEGLPVVLMEALLAGIPCVTTQITGIPELIQHQQQGFLVPAGNAQAFANALFACLADLPKAQQMAQSGRQRVLENHDIRQNAKQIDALFRRLQHSPATQEIANVTLASSVVSVPTP